MSDVEAEEIQKGISGLWKTWGNRRTENWSKAGNAKIEISEEYVIKLVRQGRISIGKGAELLGLTIYDMYEIADRHGLRLGASSEQFLEGQENLRKLLKKK